MNRIKCFKYNYSLENQVWGDQSYHALIELSKDYKYLTFITRRPIKEVKYVLEADPEYFQQQKIEEYKKMHDKLCQKSNKRVDLEINNPYLNNKTSSASTCVSDITGFIFGGINSRFWMLRKHFNSLNLDALKMIPFHCWNCLSIQLNHREVDIVITDTEQMDMLLKFLIQILRTVDGRRGSANKILAIMNEQSIQKYKNESKREHVPYSVRSKII